MIQRIHAANHKLRLHILLIMVSGKVRQRKHSIWLGDYTLKSCERSQISHSCLSSSGLHVKLSVKVVKRARFMKSTQLLRLRPFTRTGASFMIVRYLECIFMFPCGFSPSRELLVSCVASQHFSLVSLTPLNASSLPSVFKKTPVPFDAEMPRNYIFFFTFFEILLNFE